MESLEKLKAIVENAPDGATEFFTYHGAVNYIDNHENGHQFKIWDEPECRWVFSELVDGWQYIRGRRSLSDIKRIIELTECLQSVKQTTEDGDVLGCWDMMKINEVLK
jgi:hypothetical protein